MKQWKIGSFARALPVTVVLLTGCSIPESVASDPLPGLPDEEPIELLDDGPGVDGRHTKSGGFKEDPIVFVHGCPLPEQIGSGTNRKTASYWWKLYHKFKNELGYPAADWPGKIEEPDEFVNTMDAAMKPAAGHYLNVFVYRGFKNANGDEAACGTNVEFARQLGEYVEQVRAATDSPRVDIIANSMGAIPARLFIKAAGKKRVRDVVILAGVNHGTDMALIADERNPMTLSPDYDGARELRPAYACDGQSPNNLQYELNGCVVPFRTDGVDETPYGVEEGGPIAYLNIFNAAADELCQPTVSACLNQEFPGDCRDTGVNVPIQVATQSVADGDTPHGSIRNDETALQLTVDFVTRRNRVRR